jgi:F-type H+-transporting ATPase subunit delta
MSAATEARQSELDRVTDTLQPSVEMGEELFAVADLLMQQASLRNGLADPTAQEGRRAGLAKAVFATRISTATMAVVSEAAALRWGSGSLLAAAVDRQGLRALFGVAQAAGRLDAVEEELFRFARTVIGDPDLRVALDDRNAPVAVRQQLVSDLLSGKADDVTVRLAQRAVGFARRSFEVTMEDYLRLAADSRKRAIAVVTVARPLTATQEQRLQKILIEKLNRQVNLQVVVDPSVLGGARVRVGDEVIEGTVASKLDAAEQQLTQ